MTTENTDKGQTLTEVDSQGHCALGDGSAPLTGGCLMARGGRVLRHGEVISEHDYTVRGGLANPATPVPSEWVGRRIFEGLPQPAVIRVPNASDEPRPLGAVGSGRLFEEPAGKSTNKNNPQKSADCAHGGNQATTTTTSTKASR